MPGNQLEMRFAANMTQLERELKRLQSLNDRTANGMQRAHSKAAKQAANDWRLAGDQIKRYGATIAAGLGAREVIAAADSWTRFTNSLKVAGVEGTNLQTVQNALSASANRNGVELETLGTLYSRVAQSGKDLGATQDELLKFTDGVTNALRVQGGSAADAQGALLQMSQALAGGIVRAEEFNSINEGAKPILDAVVRGTDKYGGSVSKLRAAVMAGKVTSQEFFQAFLAGSDYLAAQAAKAPLTVEASYQVLQNKLIEFIGKTDESLGASQRLGQALVWLGENIDTVAAALTVLAAAYAATYIPALGRAGAAIVANTTALILETSASGASTAALITRTASLYGVSRATVAATLATRGLSTAMAFFGGPVGIAILAIGAALTAVGIAAASAEAESAEMAATLGKLEAKYATNDKAASGAAASTDGLSSAQNKAIAHMAQTAGQVDLLSNKYYRLAAAARLAAYEQAKADYKAAKAGYDRAKEKVESDRSIGDRIANAYDPIGGGWAPRKPKRTRGPLTGAEKEQIRWGKMVVATSAEVTETAAALKKPITAAEMAPPSPTPTGGGSNRGGGRSASKPDDQSTATLARLRREQLQTMLETVQSDEARSRISAALLDLDHKEARAALEKQAADGSITKEALAQALLIEDQTHAMNRAKLATEEAERTTAKNAEINQLLAESKAEALRIEADSIELDSRELRDKSQRQALELEAFRKRQEADRLLFEAEQDRLALERERNGWIQSEIDAARARATGNFNAGQANEKRAVTQGNTTGSVADEIRDYADSFGSLNEQLGSIATGAIDDLTSGFADAIMGAKSFKEAFGDMAKAVIKALIEMAVRFLIFEALGMAFGIPGLGKASLGIGKNQAGTDYFGGGLSMVGENGPELVAMPRGSQVLPNNLLRNAVKQSGSGNVIASATNVNITVHATDAVLTDWVKKEVYQGVAAAVQTSNHVTQQDINRKRRNSLR